MRRMLTLMIVMTMALFVMAPVASAKTTTYSAELSGDNEVPPSGSDAWGKAKLRVKGDTVHFKVVVHKLESGLAAAHIHEAPPGVNGPVRVDLLANATKVKTNKNVAHFSGSFTAPPDFLDELNAGGLYVNVHTTGVPSGEVRGQLG